MVASAVRSNSHRKFFFIVAPGLEELLKRELLTLEPNILKVKTVVGGVEFETAELEAGLRLGARSMLGTRLLLRLEEFAANDYLKLFKRLDRIKWKSFLDKKSVLRFEVSAKTSKVFNKRRIAQAALESIEKHSGVKFATGPNLATEAPRKASKFLQRIYLRFENDMCLVSIDCSGESLFKRGYKTLKALAPIRENLASALLSALLSRPEVAALGDFQLVDPMMGSGTLLLEAFVHFCKLPRREFAFDYWPCVRSTAKTTGIAKLGSLDSVGINGLKSVLGLERGVEAVELATLNFATLKKLVVAKAPEVNLQMVGGDAVGSSTLPNIVLSNFPYGERVAVKGSLSDFYAATMAEIEQQFKPRLAGLLLSQKAQGVKAPKGWRQLEHFTFRNGGIPVVFCIYECAR